MGSNKKDKKKNLKFGNDNLGRALIKGKRRDKTINRSSMKSSDATAQTIANMGFSSVGHVKKSVTETSDLEAFISDALLANRSFLSERRSRILNLDSNEGEAGQEFISEAINNDAEKERPGDSLNADEEIVLAKTNVDEIPQFDHQNLSIPRRPAWTHSMTTAKLDENERAAFVVWRRGIAELEAKNPGLHVSPFEKNLDFWRQLWRVIERSDIVVQVVDARNPLLFRCIDVESMTRDTGAHKLNLLLINKADFLSEELRIKWRNYFQSRGISFLFFSAKLEIQKNEERVRLGKKEKNGSGEVQDTNGIPEVDNDGSMRDTHDYNNETISDIVHSTEAIVSRTSLSKTLERLAAASTRHKVVVDEDDRKYTSAIQQKPTVGMIGYPNVGKSSVINAIFGVTAADHATQRVSVSATPGHTKCFQTLHLSDETIFCDCPGLVFPTFMRTKADLICNGILPIDEIRGRDFFPAIEVMSRCIPRKTFEQAYGLHFPLPDVVKNVPAELLLVSFCEKRGLHAQGHGRLNEAYGARIILKDFVKGKLCYCVQPPSSEQFKLEERLSQNPASSLKSELQTDKTSIVVIDNGIETTGAELSTEFLSEEDSSMENEKLLFSENLKLEEAFRKQSTFKKKQTKHQRRKERPEDPYGKGDYFGAQTMGNAKEKRNMSSRGVECNVFTRTIAPYSSSH